MKNSLLSFRFKMTSALIIITAIVLNVNGQKTGASSQVYDDNPNRDQIPQWYLEQIQGSTKAPSVVVTDADNFDNFYLYRCRLQDWLNRRLNHYVLPYDYPLLDNRTYVYSLGRRRCERSRTARRWLTSNGSINLLGNDQLLCTASDL